MPRTRSVRLKRYAPPEVAGTYTELPPDQALAWRSYWRFLRNYQDQLTWPMLDDCYAALDLVTC